MISAEGLFQNAMGPPRRDTHSWDMEQPQHVKDAVGRPLVSIVDDDESVRESLPDLVRELGFAALAFSSAKEFLASDCASDTECLILDIMMPGMSGPELQEELKRRRRRIPIVFITAQTSETLRARMIERGAVECLVKPFSDTALLDALNLALRTN
jgi:FixJ family two-component response regulator